MVNQDNTLHFSFGPVQDFVAQARKTRDLWAGSYLLSWLAGNAMKVVLASGGKIVSPDVEEDGLMKLIHDPIQKENYPDAVRIGSLPNRFTAKIPAHIQAGDVAHKAAQAIHGQWKLLGDAVRNYLNGKGKGVIIDDNTWNRQMNSFWEVQWVIGEDGNLLNQRKNMRCHLPESEPGEKCTMCGERKEISQAKLEPLRISEIRKWWKKNVYPETISDLREEDRLCAVCLTKRLFPIVSQDVLGWKASKYFPSTGFMAALDWMEILIEKARENEQLRKTANDFIRTASENLRDIATEYHTYLPFLEKKVEASGLQPVITTFDGGLFHPFVLREKSDLDFKFKGSPEKIRAALAQVHKGLAESGSQKTTATPFYALLLMDGDGMGAILSRNPEEHTEISQALSAFTQKVPAIVSAHHGWLIYAGGDDVFALLPLNKAIDCALACKTAYEEAFRCHASFLDPAICTISAAIQYAHMKTPLGPLVKDAHLLLDKVAKDAAGRNALACRVWKRGGPILTWFQPWDRIVDNTGGNILDATRRAFQNDSEEPDQFSSRFFYKLRDIFEFINTGNFSNSEILDLLSVEYLATREHQWGDLSKEEIWKKAVSRLELITKLCGTQQCTFSADGALLVRFLSQKEV
ncbi:type III-B CRISPR-associated protein Cas10/Cmr2 [Desulfosarcina sp. OttesenSCG-928-A07]|nr:type III-B CRISPR-associated protein Cas10/Cmr2 [Desulfosarcina sp. OttesenSCG-928-G17]MDL2330006.1 type III-B CRISPR-associated protein Cas10/Cmr2 [Desulfosarcina sp. OttesenSCG-928-A07]